MPHINTPHEILRYLVLYLTSCHSIMLILGDLRYLKGCM